MRSFPRSCRSSALPRSVGLEDGRARHRSRGRARRRQSPSASFARRANAADSPSSRYGPRALREVACGVGFRAGARLRSPVLEIKCGSSCADGPSRSSAPTRWPDGGQCTRRDPCRCSLAGPALFVGEDDEGRLCHGLIFSHSAPDSGPRGRSTERGLGCKRFVPVRKNSARARSDLGGGTLALAPNHFPLQAGHIALIEQAKARADTVAATIFVNPISPCDGASAAIRDRRNRHSRLAG